MAKSRRLERSTSSFSYSSYHTLEEVGRPSPAPGSASLRAETDERPRSVGVRRSASPQATLGECGADTG